MRKPSFSHLAAAILAVVFLASCGSDSSSEPAPAPTSKLQKRVFLGNAFTGVTHIIDAATDRLSLFTVNTTGRPAIMRSIPAQHLTVVYEDFGNTVQFIDNSTESVIATVTLSGQTESLALQSDGSFVYAPIRNLARIEKIDVVNRTVATIPNLPQVRRVVLSPDNAKLLAFSDDSDSVQVIHTADNTVLPAIPGFDRAYTAVFAADSSRAFVLSCGPECGGTQAKISVLDMATNTITGEVNVEGATVALLDGSNLYVAGNRIDAGNVRVPRLNIVNTTNLSVAQPAVTVHDGLHNAMALGANGRLFIGGNQCNASCLTIFNTSSQSAVQSTEPGPVSSILPITGRQVVYVVQNGDLKIYNTATDALQTDPRIDISRAVSVMSEAD